MNKCIILIVPINKFRIDSLLNAIRPELNRCNLGPDSVLIKNVVRDSPNTEIVIYFNNKSLDDINIQRLLVNIKFQGYSFEIKCLQMPQYAESF